MITVKFNLCAVTPFSRQYLIREILGFKGKITFVPYLKDLDITVSGSRFTKFYYVI